MTFDWDDHHEGNNAMEWMWQLKELNPAFKATLFSVPALGSEAFWRSHPPFIEIAWHGWLHPSPYECAEWTRERMERYLDEPILRCSESRIWKAPGWQVTDAIYEVLLERGWAIADQHLEDWRRPNDLPVYFYEDGNYHGHVQNVCGNGLRESWDEVCEKVASTSEFLFASEAAKVFPTVLV